MSPSAARCHVSGGDLRHAQASLARRHALIADHGRTPGNCLPNERQRSRAAGSSRLHRTLDYTRRCRAAGSIAILPNQNTIQESPRPELVTRGELVANRFCGLSIDFGTDMCLGRACLLSGLVCLTRLLIVSCCLLWVASPSALAAHGGTSPEWHLVITADNQRLTPAAESWIQNYTVGEDQLWQSQGGPALIDSQVFKRGLFSRLLPRAYPDLPWTGATLHEVEYCLPYFPHGCWFASRDDLDFGGGPTPQVRDDAHLQQGTIGTNEGWLSATWPTWQFDGLWLFNNTEILTRSEVVLWGPPFNPDYYCNTATPGEWGTTLRSDGRETVACWTDQGQPDYRQANRALTISHVVESVRFQLDDPSVPNVGCCVPWRGGRWSGQVRTYLLELPEPIKWRIIRWIASRLDASVDDPYLAHKFRPHIRYDSGETYRPLDADQFFGERDDQGQPLHSACNAFQQTCWPLASKADLPFSPDGYIDVAGDGNADNYHSPYDACTENGRRDCDTGPRSAIYYWLTTPAESTAYYHDYWIFYRYNDWPFVAALEGSDHEGDWESVTIAGLSTNPATFDFASFSQHGRWFSYLRENLSCSGVGPGSCGTTASPTGERVDVYVSKGSHANYADQCDEDIFTNCSRNDDVGLPIADGSRNGEALWGNDSEPDALLPLPTPADASTWTAYPGDWGAPPEFGPNGPAHGGNGSHFYAPWVTECARDNGPDCPGARPSGAAASRRASARGNDRCGAWFGADVVAAACATPRLRAAIGRRRLAGRGSFRFSFEARSATTAGRSNPWHRVTASAPGLAQTLGRPLRPGEKMALRGRAAADTQLLIRAATRRGQVRARFTKLGLQHGGKVVITASRRAAWPTLAVVRPDGKIIKPQVVERTELVVPGRPMIRSITRQGRLVNVAYRSPGTSAMFDVSKTRRGAAVIAERQVRAGGSRRLSVRIPTSAAYFRMVGQMRNGARSQVRIVPMPPK
jgi:hypothetical protein